MKFLDELQKYVSKAVGPACAASLEDLKCDQPGSFYGHYLERNSSESAELVPLPYSYGWFKLYNLLS